jgi:hypothetical protein
LRLRRGTCNNGSIFLHWSSLTMTSKQQHFSATYRVTMQCHF